MPAPNGRKCGSPLANLGDVDLKRVKAIGIGTMGPPGPFRFQIDDVRVE